MNDVPNKDDLKQLLDRSRNLINEGQLADARELLLGVVDKQPKPAVACQLARIALKEKAPELAQRYLEPHLKNGNPGFTTLLLMGRASEQLKNYQRAADFYQQAHTQKPDAPGPGRALQRIKPYLDSAMAREDFEDTLEQIQKHIENGSTELALQPAAFLRSYRELIGNLPWHEDSLYAKVAHFAFKEDLLSAIQSYNPELISMSVEYGYLTWPKRIQNFILNKSVLDVGCGFGGYGTGFLAAGTREYTGLDPAMDLDSKTAKNKILRAWASMPKTPRQIMESNPQITLIQGKSEDIAHSRHYDVISLHNVTEHLMDIGRVFEGFRPLMLPETMIVFLHHHFYAWNGHHHAPVKPENFAVDDEMHKKYADWAHVIHGSEFPEDDYINTGLNQITLEELKSLTEQHFEIVQWQENYSRKPVLERLTPELLEAALAARPNVTRKDLELHTVFCVARLKD